jgi:Domain of unknown function (DUF1707)
MAGSGDEMAAGAAGHSHLLASHADREQVIDVLKAAFVQGRLDKTEFDLRVGGALASRTYADLAALTADIPAGLTTARAPEPARPQVNKKALATVACATPVLVGMMAALQVMPDATPWPVAILANVFTVVLVLGVSTGWLWLLHQWIDMRAGRQSGPGLPPGGGGKAPQQRAPANPSGKPPQAGPDPLRAAEASPVRRPRPALRSRQTPNRVRLSY